jgi:hypothetical protein
MTMTSLRDPFLLTLKTLCESGSERSPVRSESHRLNLNRPAEYALFSVLREFSSSKDEAYLSDCARHLVEHLGKTALLDQDWSGSDGGRQRVERSLLAEILVNEERYGALRSNLGVPSPSFLEPAIAGLARLADANARTAAS